MVKQIISLFMLGLPMLVYSQTSVNSSSSTKTSSNGYSMTHVIGQVARNTSKNGQLSAGVLSKYTVTATTGLDLVDMALLSIYPNPTEDVLLLKTSMQEGLSYMLSSSEGKILFSEKIVEEETAVDFSQFSAGIYYLTLRQQGKVIKTFSIIKK